MNSSEDMDIITIIIILHVNNIIVIGKQRYQSLDACNFLFRDQILGQQFLAVNGEGFGVALDHRVPASRRLYTAKNRET